MSTIPGIVEGKESRITHQRYKARFAVWIAQESTSEHLYALVSSGIFSLHLLRMCLVIHPSEIACHSIGVLFICPEPQLPTAFSLLPPPDRNTKPPGDAFPSPVTSSFPEGLPSERDCLWPCPAHFQAQYQRSDSSGVRPILCIFPLRMGLSLSVGDVIWFLPRPGIPSRFLLYHTLFPWFFALMQVLDLHCCFQWFSAYLYVKIRVCSVSVSQFCKSHGPWQILLALPVDLHGVWWTCRHIWIEMCTVILGYGFNDEKKRKRSLSFATVKLERFTVCPFCKSYKSSLSELYSDV